MEWSWIIKTNYRYTIGLIKISSIISLHLENDYDDRPKTNTKSTFGTRKKFPLPIFSSGKKPVFFQSSQKFQVAKKSNEKRDIFENLCCYCSVSHHSDMVYNVTGWKSNRKWITNNNNNNNNNNNKDMIDDDDFIFSLISFKFLCFPRKKNFHSKEDNFVVVLLLMNWENKRKKLPFLPEMALMTTMMLIN